MAGQAEDLGVLEKASSPLQADSGQKGGTYRVSLKNMFHVYLRNMIISELYAVFPFNTCFIFDSSYDVMVV